MAYILRQKKNDLQPTTLWRLMGGVKYEKEGISVRNYSNNAKNLVKAIWADSHDETRRLLLSISPHVNFYMDASDYTKNECDIYYVTPFGVAFDLNYEDIVEQLAPHHSGEYLKEYLTVSVSRQNVDLFDCLIQYVNDDLLDDALEMGFLTSNLQSGDQKYTTTQNDLIMGQVAKFCNHTVRSILMRKKLPIDFINNVCSQETFSKDHMDRIAEMCQRQTLNNIVNTVAQPNEQTKRKI